MTTLSVERGQHLRFVELDELLLGLADLVNRHAIEAGVGVLLNRLDTTALLIPLYDFLPADDERVQNTIDTLLDELATDDGLVVRFANSSACPREPGRFLICSFWLVDALVLSGRIEEAEEVFETLLEHTSPLGLLSEMIHAEDGTFLGNFPQAFSHIGLLNSAICLASATSEEEGLPPR